MIEAIGISEARGKLPELRKQLLDSHDRIILTHKEGNLMLVSLDEWNQLEEELRKMKESFAIVNDPEVQEALSRALANRGKPVTVGVEEVFNDITKDELEIEV